MNKPANTILALWFSDETLPLWFNSTSAFDQALLTQFEADWESASQGLYDSWLEDAKSCLALIILLDQFPLNMFRGQAKSFTSEAKAIEASLYAIEQNYPSLLSPPELSFLFMPLMHSEQLVHQDLSVEMYKKFNLKANIDFAEHHRNIVKTYGRFPHRNAILGRESSTEEIEYLNSDGAFTG